MSIDVGDWVRFYQGGKLVIGVVQYVRSSHLDSSNPVIHTDIGTVTASVVTEARSKGGVVSINTDRVWP